MASPARLPPLVVSAGEVRPSAARRSLRTLIVRLARENPDWGYRRIVGELKGLGLTVSATSVRKVLIGAGVPPAAERASLSWRAFLRRQAASALACDFLTVIRTPIRAPNANAFAERWVRTLRADCLDRILILGRRHLEHVLGVYRRHYNEHRPHRALDLQPPDGASPLKQATATERVRRRDLLGGMIHEYRAAA